MKATKRAVTRVGDGLNDDGSDAEEKWMASVSTALQRKSPQDLEFIAKIARTGEIRDAEEAFKTPDMYSTAVAILIHAWRVYDDSITALSKRQQQQQWLPPGVLIATSSPSSSSSPSTSPSSSPPSSKADTIHSLHGRLVPAKDKPIPLPAPLRPVSHGVAAAALAPAGPNRGSYSYGRAPTAAPGPDTREGRAIAAAQAQALEDAAREKAVTALLTAYDAVARIFSAPEAVEAVATSALIRGAKSHPQQQHTLPEDLTLTPLSGSGSVASSSSSSSSEAPVSGRFLHRLLSRVGPLSSLSSGAAAAQKQRERDAMLVAVGVVGPRSASLDVFTDPREARAVMDLLSVLYVAFPTLRAPVKGHVVHYLFTAANGQGGSFAEPLRLLEAIVGGISTADRGRRFLPVLRFILPPLLLSPALACGGATQSMALSALSSSGSGGGGIGGGIGGMSTRGMGGGAATAMGAQFNAGLVARAPGVVGPAMRGAGGAMGGGLGNTSSAPVTRCHEELYSLLHTLAVDVRDRAEVIMMLLQAWTRLDPTLCVTLLQLVESLIASAAPLSVPASVAFSTSSSFTPAPPPVPSTTSKSTSTSTSKSASASPSQVYLFRTILSRFWPLVTESLESLNNSLSQRALQLWQQGWFVALTTRDEFAPTCLPIVVRVATGELVRR